MYGTCSEELSLTSLLPGQTVKLNKQVLIHWMSLQWTRANTTKWKFQDTSRTHWCVCQIQTIGLFFGLPTTLVDRSFTSTGFYVSSQHPPDCTLLNWWQTESILLWQSSTTWLLQLNIGPPWHFSSWAFKATLVCHYRTLSNQREVGHARLSSVVSRYHCSWTTQQHLIDESREYTDGAKPSYTQFGSLGYTLRCTNTHYIVWKFSVLVWTCVCDYICVFCPTNQFWELVEAVSSRTTSCFVDRRLTVVDHHLVTSCWYMQGPLFTQSLESQSCLHTKLQRL